MAALPWISYLQRMVGRGHPTLADTLNTPLRTVLSQSGYDPDASPFPGLMGPVANVKSFGALGDGVTNDSIAIQAAFATGLDVVFPAGFYPANNLSQTTNGQRLIALGNMYIVKNANGPILASSGNDVQCHGLQFRGDSATPVLTGDNVTFSGNNCAMVNCGSRWAFGRAVKATGGHFQIIGTCDIYQTGDASGTGYDIELGISGTATLYSQLFGIYTSQATGGVLATDVGGLAIVGGQIGKLAIAAGTLPAGVGSNHLAGVRIVGAATVDISGTAFSACALASNLTFGATSSGCSFDISNSVAGVVTNNGNADNLYIQRGAASGAAKFPGNVQIPNAKSFLCESVAGGSGAILQQTSGDNLALSNNIANKGLQISQAGASGLVQLVVNGVEVGRFDASAVAADTRMMVYDVTAAALVRVTRGAVDSGGAGFRLLRVPN